MAMCSMFQAMFKCLLWINLFKSHNSPIAKFGWSLENYGDLENITQVGMGKSRAQIQDSLPLVPILLAINLKLLVNCCD